MRHQQWADADITPEFVVKRFQVWKRDPWQFFTDMVWTADESDLENPVKPFTAYRYLYEFNQAVEANDSVIVVKGRQMFFTWIVAARFVHNLLFKPFSRSVFMSQKETQVEDVIANRIAFILRQLDDRFPWPEFDKRSIQRLKVEHPDGEVRSLIVGTPSGPDQARGMTGSEIWLDEFGFQDEQEMVLKTVRPLIKKGRTKLIITSTPNPDTYYETLAKGIEEGTHQEIMQGVWSHRNQFGDYVLSTRYDAHPDQRSEEWIAAKRKEVGELTWRVEYCLEWTLPRGKPVFPEFQFDTYCLPYRTSGGFQREYPLSIGLDFGGHFPSAVFYQKDSLGRCVVHHAILGDDVDLDSFLNDYVSPAIAERFPTDHLLLACDPAGAGVNGQGTAAPAVQLVENHFRKPVQYTRSSPADRARAIKILMNKMKGGTPGILFAPDLGWYYKQDGTVVKGVMIEGLKHGYVYAKKRGSRMDSYHLAPEKDGLYDHLFDAWGYRFMFDFPAYMEQVTWQERKAAGPKKGPGPRRRVLRR